MTMRKSAFVMCDDHNAYIGYTSGYLWNGWATPYFTFAEARRLQADFNQNAEFPMFYDVTKDEFFYKPSADEEMYIWQGEDIQTVDGIKHLYGIGAYSHMWDELGEGIKRSLAEQINEFLYDYDIYEYRDAIDDADDFVEDIISQLANLDTFVKAYEIMNNDAYNADEIYTKLGEISSR